MENPKLPKAVIDKISEQLGTNIKYPGDCERLSRDISEKINERLGVTTLKRLFGFANDVVSPRGSTLDILSKYAGYESYAEMLEKLGVTGDSDFEDNSDIKVCDLKSGDLVTFAYLPDRKVIAKYLGGYKFCIVESIESSLKENDIIRVQCFCAGHPLYIEEVTRGNDSLGRYVAGKVSGLTSVSVFRAQD